MTMAMGRGHRPGLILRSSAKKHIGGKQSLWQNQLQDKNVDKTRMEYCGFGT
jgi:hypothetical protein